MSQVARGDERTGWWAAATVLWVLLLKNGRQQSRDLLGFCLTVGTPPFFVMVYRLVYGSDSAGGLERFMPSLLIFAVIMLIFNTAMAVAKEREQGTWRRLRRTRVRGLHYLVATGLFQSALGAMTVGLTFGTAWALGFSPRGEPVWAFVIALGAAVACIGMGLAVAALAETVHRAFLMASVAMFLLLLFSGALFPLPDLVWLELGGRGVGPLDLLPTVHAVRGLEGVLIGGQGVVEMRGELLAMAVLSLMYVGLGWWLFRRVERPPGGH